MSNELALRHYEQTLIYFAPEDIERKRQDEVSRYQDECNSDFETFYERVVDNLGERKAIEILWQAATTCSTNTDKSIVGELCNSYLSLTEELANADITHDMAHDLLIEEIAA